MLRSEDSLTVRPGILHTAPTRPLHLPARLGGCAIEHFSEYSAGISKPIKLFFVAIVGFISANESIVQPKVVNGPIGIFYGAGS